MNEALDANSVSVPGDPQPISQPKRKRKRTDLKHPTVIAEVITRKGLQHSNVQIAKDLGMNDHSVAKVLENANYNEIAKTYGQQANELIPNAFQAIKHRLVVKNDGELGRKYLVDMGVIGDGARKDSSIQVNTALHQQIVNLVQASPSPIAVPDNSAIDVQVTDNKGNDG